MTEIEQLIRREIATAIERLGGTPRWLENATPEQLYKLAEQCGAERYLLGVIGSWGDTLSDEEVLDDLRHLNAGRPLFDEVHASRADDTPRLKRWITGVLARLWT